MATYIEETRKTDAFTITCSRSDPLLWTDYSIYRNDSPETVYEFEFYDFNERTQTENTDCLMDAMDEGICDSVLNQRIEEVLGKSKEELEEMGIGNFHEASKEERDME